LRLKDTLELVLEAIEGGDKNRESVLLNVPFTPVPGADLTIAPSSKHNYTDYGMEWNNSGKNGFYADSSTINNNNNNTKKNKAIFNIFSI
jgi:hypothetical protein